MPSHWERGPSPERSGPSLKSGSLQPAFACYAVPSAPFGQALGKYRRGRARTLLRALVKRDVEVCFQRYQAYPGDCRGDVCPKTTSPP